MDLKYKHGLKGEYKYVVLIVPLWNWNRVLQDS